MTCFKIPIRHFDEHKEVQNIELMTLAGFCRNCLSKWFVEAAKERGLEVDLDSARQRIYGMPYSEWKDRYQPPATEEQLARLAAVEKAKAAKAKAGSKSQVASRALRYGPLHVEGRYPSSPFVRVRLDSSSRTRNRFSRSLHAISRKCHAAGMDPFERGSHCPRRDCIRWVLNTLLNRGQRQ
jgi:hypothetical protein